MDGSNILYIVSAVEQVEHVLQSCILRQGEPYLIPQTGKRAGLFYVPPAWETGSL